MVPVSHLTNDTLTDQVKERIENDVQRQTHVCSTWGLLQCQQQTITQSITLLLVRWTGGCRYPHHWSETTSSVFSNGRSSPLLCTGQPSANSASVCICEFALLRLASYLMAVEVKLRSGHNAADRQENGLNFVITFSLGWNLKTRLYKWMSVWCKFMGSVLHKCLS